MVPKILLDNRKRMREGRSGASSINAGDFRWAGSTSSLGFSVPPWPSVS